MQIGTFYDTFHWGSIQWRCFVGARQGRPGSLKSLRLAYPVLPTVIWTH